MKYLPQTIEYTLEASEFDWVIQPGKTIRAWGFNQQVPGPLLKARQGDTLVVKLVNHLPEPTLIHWHGVRLSASMDGTGEVQEPVQPGETFEYRFELTDAGTFWYHSHQNETVQMERGMYGGIVVESPADPVVDNDRIFLLDDMKLTRQHRFKRHAALGRWMERHDGREGETLLINGKEGMNLNIHAGQIERWRFVNSASARYFRLSLQGKPFQLIATDGGLLETPRTETELLITPGERFDILVGPFAPYDHFTIDALTYNRITFTKPRLRKYASVHIMEKLPSKASIPEKFEPIPALASKKAAITRRIKMSVGLNWKRGLDFLVNGERHHDDKPVVAGELQVWEIANTSMMDHPFHLHGFFFQVLEVNGQEPAYRAWKDTYNLKPKSKIKIAWMPDNRPGRWMYHCHILEHHEAGMMGHFEVVDPTQPTSRPARPAHACHS